jgi:hypothetical protein
MAGCKKKVVWDALWCPLSLSQSAVLIVIPILTAIKATCFAGHFVRLDSSQNHTPNTAYARVKNWSQGSRLRPRSGDPQGRPLRQFLNHLTICQRFACSRAVTKARPRLFLMRPLVLRYAPL